MPEALSPCFMGLRYIKFLLNLPVLIEQCDAFHSAEELLEKVAFVGGVDGVALQSESHQQRVDAEYLLDLGQNRDAAAAAGGYGLDSVYLADGPARGLVGAAAYRDQEAVASLAGGNFHLDALGRDGLEVPCEQSGYL